MKDTLILAENISKSFIGVQALKNVDIEIKKGEIKCLAGENGCGKSTLVKILSGVHTPDQGIISIKGKKYDSLTPITAIEEGVQVIYQDLSLFPHMTVAENIAMNKMIYTKKKLVNWKEMNDIAKEQLKKIGATLNLEAPVRNLSIANKQLVAICRALSLEASILFMDEPTTALTKNEVDRLLSIVLGLKAKGISVVFISHKLDEVFEISDGITVLRDGKKVGDFSSKDLNPKSLSYYMTGKEIGYTRYKKVNNDNDKILEVKNLSKKGMFKDINFTVNKGDILGIIGLLGAGRTEIALSLFGLNDLDSGEVLIENKLVNIDSPAEATKHGIALLPEDRLTQGLFLGSSVKLNITATILKKIKGSSGTIDNNKQNEIATKTVNNMNVNNKDIEFPVGKLSGGNQQKIAIGKWMVTDPKLFILDTPTVGVDIGSKSEIYDKIQESAKAGMGIIMISDEIEEIMANCNKLLIMHEGRIIKSLDEEELSHKNIQERIAGIINNPLGRSEDEV